MPDWPVLPLYVFLVLLATARGGATFLLGRGARHAAQRRWRIEGPWVQRGEDVVRRFGAPAVTLCFLTVGLQTAVLLSAGTLRMPLRRFVPALLAGALLWAGIYSTIGIAAVEAFWGNGRVWVVVAAVAGAALLAWGVDRLLERRRPPVR